ncbi:MAG: 4Fe-4S binding protein [Firmicutes bacterium]|nr:4Fe-4S binding protein [Bacillota bacterium]
MSGLHPDINHEKCSKCGQCVFVCPLKKLYFFNGALSVIENELECLYCGDCEKTCPMGAIRCILKVKIV